MGKDQSTVSSNIKEMMKAGHSQKQAIGAAMAMKRKSMKMAEGGMIDEDRQMPSPIVEEGETMADSHEAAGPERSDARDVVEQGAAMKPMIPEDVDQGSMPREMNEANTGLSEEIMDIIRKHKNRFKQEQLHVTTIYPKQTRCDQ